MSVLLSDCPLCPFSPFFPALAELQQANLITSAECQELDYMYGWYLLSVQCFWWYAICDVVRVQRRKSPEVAFQTADILRRHAFEKESKFLAGRQSRPSSICLCYIVQWNLLLISIILSSFFHFNFHLEWK